MSFDKDEANDPTRTWYRKDRIEIFSDEVTETTEDCIERLRTVYDKDTGSLRNERLLGVCCLCGDSITAKDSYRCANGCQVCKSKDCSKKYNGRRLCRRDIEVELGTRDETIVLIGLKAGLRKNQIKDLAQFSESQLFHVINSLAYRRYVVERFCDPFNTPKISAAGNEVLPVLADTYSSEPNFQSFLIFIGERYVQAES